MLGFGTVIIGSMLTKLRLSSVIILMITVVGSSLAALAATEAFDVLKADTQPGMLVSLTPNAGVVEPATSNNASFLTGVITTGDEPFDIQPGQVSVETGGEAQSLVSTINGDIKVGDRITVSALAGVGAKATGSSWIIGIAQGSLDAKSAGAVVTTVDDSKGNKRQVYIARVPVVVNVAYYVQPNAAPSSTPVPNKLQDFADAVAGKRASLIAVVLGSLVLLVGVFMAGVIVNSSIRGAIAAVARQPLSRASVFRMQRRSFAIAMLILTGAVAGAFLVVRIL